MKRFFNWFIGLFSNRRSWVRQITVAAVLTHLRSQWGNQAAEVTPLQVNRIRALQGR